MSAMPAGAAPMLSTEPAPLLGWERHAGLSLDVMPGSAPRAIIVGTAGAGKSLALQHLRVLIEEQPRGRTHQAPPLPDHLSRVPSTEVVLVDDLHLLSEEALRPLSARLQDPHAALIATTRPGPLLPEAAAVVRMLERRTPPILLGHVSRADLLDHLEALGRRMPEACVEHLLQQTGGVSWLTSAAVQHHDERDCARDPEHRQLRVALVELVAHRLETVEPEVRRTVEAMCFGASLTGADESTEDELLLRGYSEGLLLRGGSTAPLIRDAVRTVTPLPRLVALSSALPDSADHPAELRRQRDPRVADALVARGDRLLPQSPTRAAELYDAAIECGAAPEPLAERRARAAWASGDLDRAASVVDAQIGSGRTPLHGLLLGTAAAVWSARGMLARADEVYRGRFEVQAPDATEDADRIAGSDAVVAAIGVGRIPEAGIPAKQSDALAPGGGSPPTTLAVAMDLLRDGLCSTLRADGGESSSLPDLVRAAEMYTGAQSDTALCEPPAVIAAIVALNLGRPSTAAVVLEDAITGDHGGSWTLRRLLLWAGWVAVQRARIADAATLLARADADDRPLHARDALLRHAVQVAIARRQDDASALESAWHRARAALLRVDMDIYLAHPLGELVIAAAMLGESGRVDAHLERALHIVDRLGEPPLWAAHVHWSAIQQGILTSSPSRLSPHAKALVAAAEHSRVAACMARAGRVWTDVLAGHVDAESIIACAKGLAGVGLLWDAARLAGHGAARCEDRRVAAQLLACARELHPSGGFRRAASIAPNGAERMASDSGLEALSDREIEVARLVLQGRTYAEIGATIFISPRTAEHHIAHIRRRLGAQTRSELLARLRMLLGAEEDFSGYSRATPVTPHSVIGGTPDARAPGRA